MNSEIINKNILSWFDSCGRKNLPWQQNKNAYRVWVSEIMLQQTQVTTVIPYFLRFMERFPDISLLANSSVDEVLHLWSGLGYYSRARNLHQTARIIHEKFQGKFPDQLSLLEELPGIGRSTAGAILAIAFQKRVPILDGNVKRVLTRLHGITEWPGEKKITERLWQLAEKYTPSFRVDDYTQAIMDLGATLCTRSDPQCDTCPLINECLAHQLHLEKIIPAKKPIKKIPTRHGTFLILKNHHSVLLEKRPAKGVWGGLWSFPECSGNLSLRFIKTEIEYRFSYPIKTIKKLASFRHTFTHFHLEIHPVVICIKKPTRKIVEDSQQIWYNLQNPQTVGLPAPIKILLSNLKNDAIR